MTGIAQWLASYGLDKYAGAFAEAEIDFEVLRDLTEADLEKLGVPLGPRKKLLRAISELGAANAPPRKRRSQLQRAGDSKLNAATSRLSSPTWSALRRSLRGWTPRSCARSSAAFRMPRLVLWRALMATSRSSWAMGYSHILAGLVRTRTTLNVRCVLVSRSRRRPRPCVRQAARRWLRGWGSPPARGCGRADRRGRGTGAGGGRRDPQPRRPSAGGGRAGPSGDRRGDAAAGGERLRAARRWDAHALKGIVGPVEADVARASGLRQPLRGPR